MSKKSFKPTPIPHRSTFGEPMQYYILSEDGERQTKVTRAECLVRAEEPDNPYPQRWFVDEESGLVVRLPRTAKGDELARVNMRSVWRETKYQERWAGRTVGPIVDGDGDEVMFEPVDSFDMEDFMEEQAKFEILSAALADLTQEDSGLIKAIFWGGKTERQLAPELGLKEPKSVNKRKHRILEILRGNEALHSFFE